MSVAIKSEWLDKLDRWRARPDFFVREVFKAVPDPWQEEVLRAFPTSPRIAMKAAKGPGKTTTLAWLCWNFLLTRDNPNIAAVSISGDNLRDNLWKEMAIWHNKSKMLLDMFEWQKERIVAKHAVATWWMSARNWPKSADVEQLGATMAGLHSKYVMAILDESGAMPIQIPQAAEGIFAGCIEAHIVQAGNTNTLEGALYHACVKQAHLWKVVVINGDPDNPLRSPRIPLEWARQQIAAYGRENPFIKVTILGEWPSASLNALIGPDEVETAMKRCYREYEYYGAPKILGVDVAREGDDASVIFKRQGIISFPPLKFRGLKSIEGAGQVVREWNNWGAHACFIDMTGGHGAGWFDQIVLLGKGPVGVQYAGQAHRPQRYVNKRTEMYFDAIEWIKRGGQLPPVPELTAALTQTLYTFQGDRLLLEPKEVIKAKLGYSPDDADAFVQTFAEPVAAPETMGQGRRVRHQTDFNPYAGLFERQE